MSARTVSFSVIEPFPIDESVYPHFSLASFAPSDVRSLWGHFTTITRLSNFKRVPFSPIRAH